MKYLSFKDLNKKQYLKILKYCFLFKKKKINIKNKKIGIVFELPSTRTKNSFLIACDNLGINAIEISIKETQNVRGERKSDVFKIMSLYFDLLIIRSEKITKYNFFNKIIINALSKNEHPTQIINDIFTIIEKKGNFNLNITWIGRCNNVFKSLYYAKKIFNFKLKVFSLNKEIKKYGIKNSKNAKTACKNTDIIMSDTWISMGEKKKKNYKKIKVKDNYIKNNTLYMHCLPLYIGKEIDKKVLRNKNCIIWDQAKNKIVSSQAILYYFLK
ncbi:ornithine carbamoyltransferase [Candidatus Vidania fulgoroideorum]